MPQTTTIKPTHKAIQQYYQSLKDYRGVGVKHEGAVETAFQRLLEHIAKLHHCQLIPKHKLKVGAHLIYPDGTVFEKELGDLGLRLVEALVSHSFNRDQFLKSLDRFYRAIEEAAHTLEDFAEKQHFLNTGKGGETGKRVRSRPNENQKRTILPLPTFCLLRSHRSLTVQRRME